MSELLSKYLFYEFVVDSGKCVIEVVLLNADDDRELARALVDHTDVDARVRDRVEYSCRSSLVLDHTETYDCDERKSVLYGDAVGTDRSVDRSQDLIASAIKNLALDTTVC